jgi:23S rRNA (uridine2552-2'-O)-methyltransferase
VLQARRDGWRSRAVFKLEQIVQKEKMLKANMTCIDLGAAPGSWSQYVSIMLKGRCQIIALDILSMDILPSVKQIQGDFAEDHTLQLILSILDNSSVDLVMSDMSPNISGNKVIDQPRSMHLAELALDLANKVLRRRGNFICKLFEGRGTEAFITESRKSFERIRVIKPKASRPDSSEIYLVARNYQL